MKVDVTNFWDTDSVPNIPLTKQLVSEAETTLGVKLPALLLELLAIQNGGYTRGFVFPMKERTSWSANHVPLADIYGILPDSAGASGLSLLDSPYLTEEWGLPEKQVTLTGDGHWFITLDYRQGNSPSVRWIDTEMNEDIAIADNFENFIAGLVSEDEFSDEDI